MFSQLGLTSSSQIGIATAVAGHWRAAGRPAVWPQRRSVSTGSFSFYAIFGLGLLFIAVAHNPLAGVAAAFVAQVGNGMLIL